MARRSTLVLVMIITIGLLGVVMVHCAQADPCGAIVGQWHWFTGGTVTIKANGTMVYEGATNDGTWECTDSSRRQYTLKWHAGGFVNKMALSADGRTLSSTDKTQAYVSATRIGAPPQDTNVKVPEESKESTEPGKSPKSPSQAEVAAKGSGIKPLELPFPKIEGSWDRNAVYRDREEQLKEYIVAHPNDPDALVALASFYLKPLAPRKVKAFDDKVHLVMVPLRNEVRRPIKDIYAVQWVFRGDPDAAYPLLKKALELNPHHAWAIRQMAMLYRMKHDLDRMRPYMEAALKVYPMDLDLCRLYLDHRTALAAAQNQQASILRMPRAIGPRGTTGPSAADLARAKQLDAQAQNLRSDAVRPLQHLMHTFANDPNIENEAANKSTWRLASAIYYDWTGDLDKAGGAALGALRADPTSLDALDYIVDLLRLTHTSGQEPQYKELLDLWSGGDSGPTLIDDQRRVGPRR